MPLLLLIPLLLLAVLALWAILLPFTLWARYTSGRARRRAQPWLIRLNAWLLLLSLLVFAVSVWIGSRWLPEAARDGLLGVLVGVVLGVISLWMTRFEHGVEGAFHYTSNRWLVLGLTVLIALRIAAGLWLTWRHFTSPTAQVTADWLQAGGLFAVAGLLLGYYVAYTWGLRARLTERQSP